MTEQAGEPGTGRFSVARVYDGWYAACRSDELADDPLARTVLGRPVALFRDRAGRAAALLDRCPHRNAPLSAGTVDDRGHLACPYHGWRFDGGGACREVPGLLRGREDPARQRAAAAFATCEQDGFVWLWGRADAEPAGRPVRIPHVDDPDYLVVVREYDVECTLHAALENALDVPHTAFVHRGDFRGKETHEIEAVRRRVPGGIEVEYVGEPALAQPEGAETPVLSEHWDRFFLPSVAQVEYRTPPDRHTVTTLPHTPVNDFRTRFWLVSCWRIPAARGADMRPRIEKQLDTILGQDLEILRAQAARIRELGGESYRSTELDLMGPEILRMLRQAERGLPTDTESIERSIRMRVL